MRMMRLVKAPCTLIFLTVLLSLCLLVHWPSSPGGDMHFRMLLKAQYNSEKRDLVKLLRRAAMPDNTIILTILDREWARPGSIFDLFLQSFKIGQGTKRFMSNLLVAAMDSEAFWYCKAVHPHCYHLHITRTKSAEESTRVSLEQKKNDFLLEVLKLGYNVIYTDADVMWLRNPFAFLDPAKEITFACEYYSQDCKKPDLGFSHVKSNDVSIEFFKYWKVLRVLYPTRPDQSLIDMILRDKIFDMLGLSIKYISTAVFGGFCQSNNNMPEIRTLHANCCNNTEDKTHDLKLVLDEWRNFTNHMAKSVDIEVSDTLLKAPLRCLARTKTLN